MDLDLQLVLHVLSLTAIVSTVILFFCGIPICVNIYRRRSSKDISGMPFLMGLLGGSFWLRYGFMKTDFAMITVNGVAVPLFFSYCIFYLIYSKPKSLFLCELSTVLMAILAMCIYIYMVPNIDCLGIVCMTFNIINFGAPLAGLGVVLRRRCVDSLPLPLCIANLAVSSQWFLYGNLMRDVYIMIPNGIGMCLSVMQISLFIIFPMKERGRSPLSRLFSTCTQDIDGSLYSMLNSADRESAQTSSTFLTNSSKILRKLSVTIERSSSRLYRSGSLSEKGSACRVVRPRALSVPDVLRIKPTD